MKNTAKLLTTGGPLLWEKSLKVRRKMNMNLHDKS